MQAELTQSQLSWCALAVTLHSSDGALRFREAFDDKLSCTETAFDDIRDSVYAYSAYKTDTAFGIV